MKIVISSGHGSKVSGANDLIKEHEEAVRVVNKTAEYLRNLGVNVVTFEDTVSETQNENLERIVNFHNSQGPHDLDISIHFNSSNGTTSQALGTECWYYTGNAKTEQLAESVAEDMAGASGLIDRGSKDSNGLYFLVHTNEPAILDEVCFVNSRVDVDLYGRHFDEICEALAAVLAGEEAAPIPPPEPSDGRFRVQGRCSWFGGPDDTGVSSSEGLAFIYDAESAPHLFLLQQPSGTTGLARRLNPDIFYVACRWDYDDTPKDMLINPQMQALVKAHGKEFLAWPADWGPHEDTGRVADLSPGLLEALGLSTDDEVEVIYPAKQP